MQLSDNDKQTWYAEQELLDRVMTVVCCPGPCARVTVDAALLDRPAPNDVPHDLMRAPTVVPTESRPVTPAGRRGTWACLSIPNPREESQA